jgi:hypothetical protein
MKQWEGIARFRQLTALLIGEVIKRQARQPGDTGRWTRSRALPLADMLCCILAKKGLTATMELRQYFQAARGGEEAVSKQDYLRQRQHLNPTVFRALNRAR